MKKLGFMLLVGLIASGCATIDINSVDSLLKNKEYALKRTFDAPSDKVFKIAKSLALNGPCARNKDIKYDEITGRIYSMQQGPYGLREIIWLMIVEPITENSAQIEFIWSSSIVYSRGLSYDLKGTEYENVNQYCSAKNIFKGTENYIKNNTVEWPH